MQYRKFGKLNFVVSTFGLGCMRLPLEVLPDGSVNYARIDQPKAIDMIRYAVDNGVNYIDTAYIYHEGNSEVLLGKALKNGYREKVKLATKLPVWHVNEHEDFEKLLDEQLSRLETGKIDFYLIHSLDKQSWEKVCNLHVFDFLKKAVRNGKISHIGFSFHDEFPVFKEIIDSYDWDMCQIQLNLLDTDCQAGVEGLRYAADKGIPVVIMEPLKGGRLANNIPNDIRDLWDSLGKKRNPHEWAFRWLYNFSEIAVILSGVSSMEQLTDNLMIFESASPGAMNEQELNLVQQVKESYRKKIKVDCTACRYCMPCPAGVDIPTVFQYYNDASIYDAQGEFFEGYTNLVNEKKDASQCAECGQCEAVCPQAIPVISKLKEAHACFQA